MEEKFNEAQDLDVKSLVLNQITSEYLNEETWRVKENSNSSKSIGGLILHQSSVVSSNFWLSKIYTKPIGDAHKGCDMHIHDLGMLASYCFDEDTEFVKADGTTMTFKEAMEKNITQMEVVSYDVEKGEYIVKLAKNIGCKGEDDLYQLELEDGTIISGFTKWHKFLTKDGRYVSAEDLTEDDELVLEALNA